MYQVLSFKATYQVKVIVTENFEANPLAEIG